MLGSLWTHSAFIYENSNQLLLNCIKSSSGIAMQICDTFRMKCVVDKINWICNKKMTIGQKEYSDKMLMKGARPKPSWLHADTWMLGVVTAHEKVPRPHYLDFERASVIIKQKTCIKSFKRAIINRQTVHREAYMLVQKRHNYYVHWVRAKATAKFSGGRRAFFPLYSHHAQYLFVLHSLIFDISPYF